MSEEQDKKSKRQALLITAAIQAVLLLLVVFIIAWRAPDPPIPEYGIELNFGLQNTGSGEVQPESDTDNNSQEETVNEETVENETQTETTENTDVEEVTEDTPDVSQPVEDTSADIPEETTETVPETTNTTDSPDVVPETKPEEKPVEEVKPEVKETKQQEEKKPAETKPVETPKTEENSGSSSVKNSDEKNDATGNGNTKEQGDQGDKEGSVDERALFGNQGSSNGSTLELAGWQWDDEPEPDDTSQESGKIVFQITVDEDGYITRIITLEKTVTPKVEQVYRKAVEELTFSKKSDYSAANSSTGKITFIIKAN
ncbi:MAG: hypothetical protein AAFQ94_13665 [Bacteroidota bacterium]